MISTDLREMIGDLRFALATRLRDLYPRPDGVRGFSHTAEPSVARDICGADLSSLNGDYYIAPGDGGGPIVVVLSEPDAGKGSELVAKDGQPYRLLQISAGGRVKLRNPRHTQFEHDLVAVLEQAA
ncbi:MAG: hypothetical protein WCF84_17280 [Anaerolineae bacterium]